MAHVHCGFPPERAGRDPARPHLVPCEMTVAGSIAAERRILIQRRPLLARAHRLGHTQALAHWRQYLSGTRCSLSRLAAYERVQNGSETAWRRLYWIRVVSEYRYELARTTEHLTSIDRLVSRMEETLRTQRGRQGRPVCASTLRTYRHSLRSWQDIQAKARQELAALEARSPLPYHQWRREREAWLRRQLATLEIDR